MKSFKTSLSFLSHHSFSSAAPIKRKTTQLKELITSKKLDFIMEAHNGLSAAIVQEAGFKGEIFLYIYLNL